jgi:hypothetical protein
MKLSIDNTHLVSSPLLINSSPSCAQFSALTHLALPEVRQVDKPGMVDPPSIDPKQDEKQFTIDPIVNHQVERPLIHINKVTHPVCPQSSPPSTPTLSSLPLNARAKRARFVRWTGAYFNVEGLRSDTGNRMCRSSKSSTSSMFARTKFYG